MSRIQQLLLTVLAGSATAAQLYSTRVLATSPLRYNKLNEASGTAIVDSSGNGYTGMYTGVELANADSPFLPDKAPLWDGTNDYGNLYSAAFASAFNMDEFTILYWLKVSAAGVWTDSTVRYLGRFVRDANNQLNFNRAAANNRVTLTRIGNATTKTITLNGLSSTDWFSLAISCSVAGGGLLSAGDLRAYINGVEVGTAQTGNVASTGTGLNSTQTILGALNTTPSNVWSGYFAQHTIWNRPIDAEILALMTP